MPPSTTAVLARVDTARTNRFLAALPLNDFSLLAPHLRIVELTRGVVLHEAGEPIEHVYFPHTGMVSVVTIMRNGATVETASLGRTGVIGAGAGFGGRRGIGRAIVQLPGTASRMPAARFHAAAQESAAIRELAVRYNDLLIAQIQQSVACNACTHWKRGSVAGCCRPTIVWAATPSRSPRNFSARCSACAAPR